ncbi:hypothetical protein EI555_004697 [Monodon monoceros]|uniref:Sulfotransferase n=1 Tax=Monodon monoceros TaxID=40151 RepID=A0A4U1EBW2_MONMO|nr:hypothetical protein EI555_004697 [Monodon monoceros]
MTSESQSSVLHKFKGILFSTMSSEELLNSLDSSETREDDVFLVSSPKSGKAYFNIIYITRNPKDTAVSLFHYYRENPNLPGIETWHELFELFLRGDVFLITNGYTTIHFSSVVYGSWFDHVLSWEEHKNAKNILIISYEEMKKDPSKTIKKITAFLGLSMSDGEINQIAWKTSFTEMKNNTTKENCDPNHTICALTSNRNLVFRKGKSEM